MDLGCSMKRIAVVGLLSFGLLTQAAKAESIGPEKAAELLAHAWMVDNRCNVLGSGDRDTLTNLVARAELLLAEKQSVSAARDAIGRGRASGTSASCDSASADDVQSILKAAKSAAAGLGTDFPSAGVPSLHSLNPPQPAPPALKPVAKPAPRVEPKLVPGEVMIASKDTAIEVTTAEAPVVNVAASEAPATKPAKSARPSVTASAPAKPAKKQVAANPVAMRGYAQTAEAYYKELRCRRKPLKAVNAMYATVLKQHRQAVAEGGKSAVRALLRAAEARASRGAC